MQGYGDRLARGGSKASFMPPKKVSDEKWAAAFDDFDPEKFRNQSSQPEQPKKKYSEANRR